METGAVYRISKKRQRSGGGEGSRQRALRLIYPHMVGTAKARQTREAFAACDMTIDEDGSGRSKKRKNGWEGRTHSAATKEEMSAVRRAYWERRRGQ